MRVLLPTDATLTVKIKGQALGERYTSGYYLYTGARLSGEVVMEVGKEVYRFELEELMNPPSVIIGEPPHREPSEAPFEEAWESSNFYTILMQIIGKVYSLAYIVDNRMLIFIK